MSRALQCLPSFQNFLEERSFEKVKNGRSSDGLLATKKERYRFILLPPWTRTYKPNLQKLNEERPGELDIVSTLVNAYASSLFQKRIVLVLYFFIDIN